MGEGFTAAGGGAATVPAAAGEQRLALRFVGSGSEYFRIWVVNLLLTLVTFGLYYPWAKVRRLRYFFGSTEVGGRPLSFHADPRRMFKGYVLVALLLGAYSLAGRFSPTAGLVAFVIVAALWPALWHSSLRFRLANTGWSGLRMAFTGPRRGAYQAMLPGFVLAAVMLVVGIAVQPGTAVPAAQFGWAAGLVLLLPLVFVLALPALFWLLRRYQHQHYALAGERTRFVVPLRSFYGLALRCLGLSMLAGLLVGITFALFFFKGAQLGAADDPTQRAATVLRGTVAVLLMLALLHVALRPYLTARLQNLVWNGTRSQHLRFESSLRCRSLLALTLKNWALMLVTLGLYFPFAAVATARLRLQAVALLATQDPETLVAAAGTADETAAGDAAGDLLGLDIGL